MEMRKRSTVKYTTLHINLCNYIYVLYHCCLFSGKCSEPFWTIFSVLLDSINSAASGGMNVFLNLCRLIFI